MRRVTRDAFGKWLRSHGDDYTEQTHSTVSVGGIGPRMSAMQYTDKDGKLVAQAVYGYGRATYYLQGVK